MGTSLREANFSLAAVYYAAGDDIKYQVLQNVGPQAASRVTMKVDNVAGVKIPVFEKVAADAVAKRYPVLTRAVLRPGGG
eukprot:3721668-Rhodomonas_salina.1